MQSIQRSRNKSREEHSSENRQNTGMVAFSGESSVESEVMAILSRRRRRYHAIDVDEDGFRLMNEAAESAGDGGQSAEILDVADGVKDEEKDRIGEEIEEIFLGGLHFGSDLKTLGFGDRTLSLCSQRGKKKVREVHSWRLFLGGPRIWDLNADSAFRVKTQEDGRVERLGNRGQLAYRWSSPLGGDSPLGGKNVIIYSVEEKNGKSNSWRGLYSSGARFEIDGQKSSQSDNVSVLYAGGSI